jgi:hypothetical protein
MAELKVRISATGAGQVQATVSRLASSIGATVSRLATVAGLAGVSAGFASAVTAGVRFNAMIEQQTVAFGTLLGSMEAAQKRLQDLTDFAARTPFELGEIVEASKLLQALTGGALAAGEQLRMVGDAAAATGRSLQETSMWIGRLYAGLESGTPVGEATLRLLEMGLISGDTARELNALAQSGGGVGRAVEIIGETFAKTSGAMAAQAGTLKGILSTLRDNLRILAADATVPIFDSLKASLEGLLAFPWKAVGERIGALIALGINSIQGGTFPQYLGLLIEAGFELGARGATAVMDRVMGYLSGPGFWRGLASAVISFSSETLRFLVVGMGELARLSAGAMLSVGESLQSGVSAALNAIGRQIQGLVNDVVTAWNLVTRQNVAPVQIGQVQFGGTSGLREASDALVEEYVQAVFSRIDSISQKLRDLIGAGGGDPFAGDLSALNRLRELMDGVRKQSEAVIAAETDPAVPAAVARRASVVSVERNLKVQLLALEQARAQVDGDFTKTAVEKYREKVALIQQERDALRDVIGYLRAQAELANDETQRQQLLGRVDAAERQLSGLNREQAGLGPDPSSFGQVMSDTLTQLQDQFGTTAQIIARGFSTTIQSAVDGVASSISGLLNLTMTWGEALRNIGQSIISGVINAISRMFAEWIAKRTLMAMKDIALSKMEAIAGMGPALMKSISSYGVAALVGAAALAAVIAASGGFREGGFTGAGDPSAPAGVVHRGEFVFSAPAVQRIGLGNLEAMHDGIPGGTAAAGGSSTQVNVPVFVDPQAFARYIREHPDARAAVVDVMNENRWRSGA